MFSTNIYDKFALPLSDSLSSILIVSSVFHAFCSALSIGGNIIVLIVYYEKPHLLANVSSFFIINLAISDLVIGLILLPLMILTNIFILCGQVLFVRAVLEGMLLPFLSSVSIWTVLGASIDRFIAIRYSHDYRTIVTRQRVRNAILFSWVYSSTWFWFPFLPGLVGKYLLMIRSFIGFLVIMVVVFSWVAVYLKLRQLRRTRADFDGGRSNRAFWSTMQRKIAKTFFCVVIVLYACFVPLWIRAIGHFFGVLDNRIFEVFAIALNLSNSAINPIVYSFTNKIFRAELLGRKRP